jgi:hypothetical protein
MYAIIYNRNGDEQARYILSDSDALDCDLYAARFARDMGIDALEGETPTERIPDGSEDYRVELTDEPKAVRCWTTANYMYSQWEN